jgi:hypothetical protein
MATNMASLSPLWWTARNSLSDMYIRKDIHCESISTKGDYRGGAARESLELLRPMAITREATLVYSYSLAMVDC